MSDKERNDFPIIRCKNIGILGDQIAILCLKSLSLDLHKGTGISWRRDWTSTSETTDPREVLQVISREVLKMSNST